MSLERFVRREELAWQLTSASSLGDGKAYLEKSAFDLVLTDFHLGDGSALEILALDLDLPVIVITGAGAEEIAVEAMRSGAYDYLIKDTERRYLQMLPLLVENALRRHASERQARMLSQALTSIHDAVWVSDLEGRLLYANPALAQTYDWPEEELRGLRQAILWADPDAAPTQVPPAEGESGEHLHRRRGGDELSVLLSRAPVVDRRGRPQAIVGVARDISERKRWETVLRDSEERYALAAAGANDGLWDWDLRRDQIFYSERWKTTLGFSDDEIGAAPEEWLDRVHPEDQELLRAQLEAHIAGSTPLFESEHRMRTRAGVWRWVQTRGLAVRGGAAERAYRLAGSLRDVHDRKSAEEELTHAALHDALTGLPNRALFVDRLDRAISRHRRHGDDFFGIVFLDLDRFKVINDSLGHVAGDHLLRAIAGRLAGCARPGDTVARLGGDEFAVLVDEVADLDQVDRVAERIHWELEAPFEIEGREVFTNASLGIALASKHYERAEEMLRDADTAMYRAKALGHKDRVVFHRGMRSDALERFDLETDLRRAIDRQELELFYQPLVDLRSGALHGFEALLRWRHSERGLLAPDAFLQIAHDTGLIVPIGWWVLGEACRRMRDWQERFTAAEGLGVSVNLDAKQLVGFEVLDRVEQALEASRLAHRDLHLEITESMIIENPTVTAAILARLREQDIGLHIDDFGTGYSSLSQLQRFPIDALKIDRSFISGIEHSEDNVEIVRLILLLAHNLGLEVMAEGIETLEQLERLRELGAEFGQGYLFARPVPVAEIEERFASGTWGFVCFPPTGFIDQRHPSV